MRILVVFGTRPEAIKMAPVIRQLREDPQLECRVCVTAQHRHLLDTVLGLFRIYPDYDLDVMRENQDLFEISTRVLSGMRDVFRKDRPDFVLVHGDTTTTFLASLSAFYERIPVGHVEAGLRTGDIRTPFPEEANRQLTARLSDMHFAPTPRARANLLAEGVSPEMIYVTGNTAIDALMWARQNLLGQDGSVIQNAQVAEILRQSCELILVTAHRRENFGAGLANVCKALQSVAMRFPSAIIVYPVHPNPNVRRPVSALLGDIPNIHLINPVEYQDFVLLMDRAKIIMTDSGGIQEEAPSLGKPVLVLREITERQEAVEAGLVTLVGTDTERIVNTTIELMSRSGERKSVTNNPYGDGLAAKRIASAIRGRFGLGDLIPSATCSESRA